MKAVTVGKQEMRAIETNMDFSLQEEEPPSKVGLGAAKKRKAVTPKKTKTKKQKTVKSEPTILPEVSELAMKLIDAVQSASGASGNPKEVKAADDDSVSALDGSECSDEWRSESGPSQVVHD